MHFDLPSLSFAFLDLAPWTIAVIVPVAGMIFAGVIGGFAMYNHHRREAMWHELARLALEKGQPIPPPPAGLNGLRQAAQTDGQGSRSRGYMVGGLINIAIGVGLFIALAQISKPTAYFAAIPFCIGIALLLAAFIDRAFSRSDGN
ncbi:MAG: DUF6249 domain-containing protein [Opitutus sp.]